jgi:hypothetical protein
MSKIVIPKRPMPPRAVLDNLETRDLFLPAPDLEEWLRTAFINSDASLVNPKHEHLQEATIGCIWTNVPLRQGMLPTVATAEIPQVQGNAWKRGRNDYWLEEWFGAVPNFLLTFYGPYVAECNNINFCAVCEHELCHCAQEISPDGEPRFDKDGNPKFGIRRHDVEEFVTIPDRYGIDACAGQTIEFVEAARRKPSIGRAQVDAVCGTCLRLAA